MSHRISARSTSVQLGLVWSVAALVAALALPWIDTSLIGEPQTWYLAEVVPVGWVVLGLLVASVLVRLVDELGLAEIPQRVPVLLSLAVVVCAGVTLALAEVVGGLGLLDVIDVVNGEGDVGASVGIGPWLVGCLSLVALLPDSSWYVVTLGFLEPARRAAVWAGLVGIALMLVARYNSFVLVTAGELEGGLGLARLPVLSVLSLVLTAAACAFLCLGHFRSKGMLAGALVVALCIGVGALLMGAVGSAATRLDSSWVEERIPAEFAEYDPEVVAGNGWLLTLVGVALVCGSAGVGLFLDPIDGARRLRAVREPSVSPGRLGTGGDVGTAEPTGFDPNAGGPDEKMNW